jgi:hypothetical protein
VDLGCVGGGTGGGAAVVSAVRWDATTMFTDGKPAYKAACPR